MPWSIASSSAVTFTYCTTFQLADENTRDVVDSDSEGGVDGADRVTVTGAAGEVDSAMPYESLPPSSRDSGTPCMTMNAASLSYTCTGNVSPGNSTL